MRWQGFAVGFLGLTLLQVVVANPAASGRVGGLAKGVGTLAEKVLSPTVTIFAPPPGALKPDNSATNPRIPPPPIPPQAPQSINAAAGRNA